MERLRVFQYRRVPVARGLDRPGQIKMKMGVVGGKGVEDLSRYESPPTRPEWTELDAPFAEGLVEEWRPHAVKRGQPATKRAQARYSGQERCSDQDGRPFTTMLT